MTVATVNAWVQPGRVAGPARPLHEAAFDRLSVGQIVNVHVLRRFDAHRYLVAIDGHAHHVDSKTALTVGARGTATVAALGEKLELRIDDLREAERGAEERYADAGDPAAPGSQAIVDELADRYRISLGGDASAELATAVAAAQFPQTMARSGLFLGRMGLPLSAPHVHALYAAQVGERPERAAVPMSAVAPESIPEIEALAAAVVGGDAVALDTLQQTLTDALDDSSEAQSRSPELEQSSIDLGGGGSGSRDGRNARELAQWLLNLQDGGAIAHRYGTLPVLVAGELVELDLVMFHQRRADGAAREPLRRLVMTLRTQTLGDVQVTAEALERRLVISFTGRSAADAHALSEHGEQVRDLVSRLGWNVESVGYSCDPQQGRAAAHVVRHVLEGGSVDQVI